MKSLIVLYGNAMEILLFSWLRRHTPFFRVKELIWLLFVTHNYFLNPFPRDLCGVVSLEEPHHWVR